MSSKKLGIFNYLSKPFVKLVEKYYPDAFIFVIVLSLLTFLLAINLTNASPVQTLLRPGVMVCQSCLPLPLK